MSDDNTNRKCGIHPDVSTAGGRCGACDAESPEPFHSLHVARTMLALVKRSPDGFTEMSNEGLAVLLRAFIERHVLTLEVRFLRDQAPHRQFSGRE